MTLHDLERHAQPLLQQEANLTYQIGQDKARLAEREDELAKVRGKLELLREMAEELSEPQGPTRPEQSEPFVPQGERKRGGRNGVVIPDLESVEEDA